jgi:hypothetical protein
MLGLSVSPALAGESLEKLKLIHEKGFTVKQFYKYTLDSKVQERLDLIKKNFVQSQQLWPVVHTALEQKIHKIKSTQKAPCTTPLAPCVGQRALAIQELQSSGINPQTVRIEFVPQNSFACNYYDEENQQYVLSFDHYSSLNLNNQHFRAAVNHELSHIKMNDDITKKFIFNMLVCTGHNPGAIKHNAAWILFNHALEHRADILPLFKSPQHAQDMLSLMGTFYEHAQEEGSEHFMSPSHPSIKKRYKKMETVVACIKAEEQLKTMAHAPHAFEA